MDASLSPRILSGRRHFVNGLGLLVVGLACGGILVASLRSYEIAPGILHALYVLPLGLCIAFAVWGLVWISYSSLVLALERTTPWRELLHGAGLTGMDGVHQRRGRLYFKVGGKLLLSFCLLVAVTWFAGALISRSGIVDDTDVRAIQWLFYVGSFFGALTGLLVTGMGLIHLLAARLPSSKQS
jgi:hypothetical protein